MTVTPSQTPDVSPELQRDWQAWLDDVAADRDTATHDTRLQRLADAGHPEAKAVLIRRAQPVVKGRFARSPVTSGEGPWVPVDSSEGSDKQPYSGLHGGKRAY